MYYKSFDRPLYSVVFLTVAVLPHHIDDNMISYAVP